MKKIILIILSLLLGSLLAATENHEEELEVNLRVSASPVFVSGKIISFRLSVYNQSEKTPYVIRVSRQRILNFSITALNNDSVNIVKPRLASAIQYSDSYGYHYDSVIPPLSEIIYEVPMPFSLRPELLSEESPSVILNVKFLYQEGIKVGSNPAEFNSKFEFRGDLKLPDS